MRKTLLTLLGATAMAIVPAAAKADVVILFNNPTGELGDDQDYTSGALTVTASGYSDTDVDEHLFGKADGGNENGVGLATNGDHEIYFDKAFIQLDVTQLFGLSSGADFFMNSTTEGETWAVYGSDTDAGGKVGATFLFDGTDEGVWHALPGWGDYDFYNFFSSANSGGANVLLGGLTIHDPVPEPATWLTMLLGFGFAGTALRFRRAKTAAA